MKIFITGISGLVGRHVAALCAQEGHKVFALVRNKKITKANFTFDVNLCYGDITNLVSIPERLLDADIVVHCAADTNMISFKNKKQEDINIMGLENMIAASKKAKIKRFIHISSATTIQSGTKDNPADERIKLEPSKFRLPYINTKIIAEQILLNEFKQNKFPVILINPTFILGPNDYNVSSGKLLLTVIKGKLLFYPIGEKNIVDARDVAQVVLNAFTRGTLGNNYLLCNADLSYKELFSITCNYAHIPSPKFKMPNFLGSIVGQLGNCYERITGKSIAINTKTIKIAKQSFYYSADKAKRELGFAPRSVDETIKDTVSWFQQVYLKKK